MCSGSVRTRISLGILSSERTKNGNGNQDGVVPSAILIKMLQFKVSRCGVMSSDLTPSAMRKSYVRRNQCGILLQYKKLFCLNESAGLQPVEIYTARKIGAIEFCFVHSRHEFLINESCNFPSQNVKYF